MAPSSNGEQGLAGTVLPSLSQSLRQGLRGWGLLIQQGKHSHVFGHINVTKVSCSLPGRQERASWAPPLSLPPWPLPGLASSCCNHLRCYCCPGLRPGRACFVHKRETLLKSITSTFWLSKAVQRGFSAVKASFPCLSLSSGAETAM